MPEARDRLLRPVDVTAELTRLRSTRLGIPQQRTFNFTLDSFGFQAAAAAAATATAANAALRRMGGVGLRGGAGLGRVGLGTPMMTEGGRSGLRSLRTPSTGRDNRPHLRRPTGNSLLPSWYPRSPLRDITAVVRANERRRTRMGEVEGQEFQTPALLRAPLRQIEGNVLDYSASTPSASLEQDVSIVSSSQNDGVKRLKTHARTIEKAPRILLMDTRAAVRDSDLLTPQKKLLDSIDTVEQVVKDELQKLKGTPTAKRADREKRVRTLMSMR